VAHSRIRGVLEDRRVRTRHSTQDIRVAAQIIAEATRAICEDIFIFDLDMS
jgi:hypothetical protein